MTTQRGEWDGHDGSVRGHEIGTAREQERLVQRDRGTQASAGAVALHRGAEAPAEGVGHPRRIIRAVGEEAQRDGPGSPPAGPREGLERRTVADAPDQAESRFRPRARRARSTARPPFVRIRMRKPCVLARLRLLGWYVRFNEEPPRGSRARPEVGDRAGGGNDSVYGSEPAGRNAEQVRARVWGKPSRPLVAQGSRWYLARLARPPARCLAHPVCHSSTRPNRGTQLG